MSEWLTHSVPTEEWQRLQACRRVLMDLAPELKVTVKADETTHEMRLVYERDYIQFPIHVDLYSALADLLVRGRSTPHPELVP